MSFFQNKVKDVKDLSTMIVQKVKESNIKEKIQIGMKSFAESSKEIAVNGYELSKKLGSKAKEKTKKTYD